MAMLNCILIALTLLCLANEKAPPNFTRDQIGDFCGCSKDTIKRISFGQAKEATCLIFLRLSSRFSISLNIHLLALNLLCILCLIRDSLIKNYPSIV